MYYKLEKSKLEERLIKLIAEIDDSKEATKKFVLEQFNDETLKFQYAEGLVGGLSAIQFHTPPDAESWDHVPHPNYNNFYFPKDIKSNKDLLKAIDKLPTFDMNRILKCINFSGKGLTTAHIGLDDKVYVRTPIDEDWDKPSAMKEISGKEFHHSKD